MIELNWKTVRFIIVGVLGALVYFICSYLFLSYTQLPAFVSSLLAYACSFGFAYLGQKYWAFRSIAPHSITLFRYAVLQAGCATFAASFTQVSVSYSDLSPLLLSGLAAVFTSGISYIVSSCWVFADASEQHLNQHLDWPKPIFFLIWLLLCIWYIFMYYYMPWNMSMFGIHDDRLFVNLAYSLTNGDWLGDFSQFTLMKGPGYAFFLTLTHISGLPLFLLVAIFHSFSVSFFSWCIYRLGKSKILSGTLFLVLLALPLVISNGRVIRDQIYPDQFLLGLSALIFSLFIADTLIKRCGTALLAGLVFAWLWLTREEGVWILPSVALLIVFALVQFWREQSLKQKFVSSVLVIILSFVSVHLAFKYVNMQHYGHFVGVDIKEKNFKEALAALQSVRDGGVISHVPVSQKAIKRIYEVSPSFLELKPFLNSPGATGWLGFGCGLYPWTCSGEYAGGWFIWLLRDAVASLGYYRTPTAASDFYARLADEINQACDLERLHCERSLLAHMPKISEQDIATIPDTLEQLYKMVLISEMEPRNIGLYSSLEGREPDKLAVLDFLHSQDRFKIASNVTITGKYKVAVESLDKIDIVISNNKGETFRHTIEYQFMLPDEQQFYPFIIESNCPGDCLLTINIGGEEKLNEVIPEDSDASKPIEKILLGHLWVTFDKVAWERKWTSVFSDKEKLTYETRQVLLVIYRTIFPVLLGVGGISFLLMSGVYIKQGTLPILYVVSCAVWLAMLVRMAVLVLVHISSFPAIIMLYSMPLYSLLLIASLISVYLFFEFLSRYVRSWIQV